MNSSESIKEIAKALCAVQSEIKPAIKGSRNPYFKSFYADLSAVWDSCRASLVRNGLCVTQVMDDGGDCSYLSTFLLHTSGEWMGGKQRLNPVKDDPQGIGSAITYARRYGLAAILGIVADEDDDGNAAAAETSSRTVAQAVKHVAKKAGPFETDKRQDEIVRLVKLLGFEPKSQSEWSRTVKSLTELDFIEKNRDLIIERLEIRVKESEPTK